MSANRIAYRGPTVSTPAREHATTLSAASRSGARAGQLVGLGAACLMAAYLLPETTAGTAVFFAGSGLLSLAGLLHFFERRRNRAEEAMFNAVSNFVEHDAAASFTTNPEGIIG